MSTKQYRYHFIMIDGKCYGKGTIVKFKEPQFKSMYGKLEHCDYLRNSSAFFSRCDENGTVTDKAMILIDDYTDTVDEIIVPVEVPYVSPQDKKYAKSDFEISGMIEMWVVYIFLMIVFSIFHGRIIFWAIISFFFFGIRSVMKKDGGYK